MFSKEEALEFIEKISPFTNSINGLIFYRIYTIKNSNIGFFFRRQSMEQDVSITFISILSQTTQEKEEIKLEDALQKIPKELVVILAYYFDKL